MRIILAFCLLFAFPLHALAEPKDDAKAAIEKGDYSTAARIFQPLAQKGDAEAQLGLGEMYLSGKGVEKKDVAQGLEWINKSAVQGNAEAEAVLGTLYEGGFGVTKDYDEALKWLHKAADQKSSLAEYALGGMYAEGKGVDKNQEEARKWFAKARRPPKLPDEFVSALKSASSVTLYSLQPWGGPDLPDWSFYDNHILGHIELKGEQATSAIAAFNEAISTGDGNAESMCLINPRHALRIVTSGHTYDAVICYQCHQLELFRDGEGLPFSGMIGGSSEALNNLLTGAHVPLADNREAAKASYAEEAKEALKRANDGDKQAEEALGKMYLTGHGVEKDKAEGVKWFVKSAGVSADAPDTELKIGDLFRGNLKMGMGGVDYAEAFNWYLKAAIQGNARAQYEVGYAYHIGEGVKGDDAESQAWLEKSADQGNAKAQYEIGVYFLRFKKPPNYAEALTWLRKAAEQGHAEAAYQMGQIYKDGSGVDKDEKEAYFWDRLAGEEGTIYGPRMSTALTPEQSSSMEKRLQDWRSQHPARKSDAPN